MPENIVPTTMDTLYDADGKSLAEAAYARFRDTFMRYSEYNDKRRIAVGFSSGTPLADFYEVFVREFGKMPKFARSKARFGLLDERRVSPDHPDSNYGLLKKTVFNPLLERGDIEEFQVIEAPNFEIPNPAEWYYGDMGKPDIGLFGVGDDGHIASLFPHHSALAVYSSRYVEVEDSPEPPSSRISVSLNLAKKIADPFVFFIGESKQEAYERFLRADETPESLPVMALACENMVVITDRKKRETEILRFL